MDLTAIMQREIHPTKLLCRIRLCPNSRQVHDGLAEWHNENKKNHDMERVEGLFHVKECLDCGRTTVICTAWRVLNADPDAQPKSPTAHQAIQK